MTVRFSLEDYETLQALAGGVSLAVYLRARALVRDLPHRRGSSGASIADKAAIAQLLGLLGQSRIANNLNQLAYQANIGALAMDDHALDQIEEAYEHIRSMRALLIRAFSESDRILFVRNDVTLGERNGMLGAIRKVGNNQLTVVLDPDDAGNRRTVTFDPRIYRSIDHGFAVSIHRAQGCTVDRSFVLSSTTLDKNLAYVAMTRHRKQAAFYTAPDIQHRRYDARRRDARAPKLRQMPRVRMH